MSTLNGKTIGAAASATMIALAGVTAIAPAIAQASDAPAPAAAEQVTAAATDVAGSPIVEGEFAYSQDVVTPNSVLSSVFAKAAATLCQSAADEVTAVAPAVLVTVCGDVDNGFTATVADMADANGTTNVIMGCTCSTNMAGGGAIANAEVSGVSLASIYAQAQTA